MAVPVNGLTDSEVMRIVVITGAPGVGKTEVARRLANRSRLPAAVLDTDSIADVRPWTADERLYRLIAVNLLACLRGYRSWGVRVLVLSGVLVPGRALDHFGPLLADPMLDWTFYALRASRAELGARALNDMKAQDWSVRMSWSHIDDEVSQIPDVRIVDTTDLTLDQVVDAIAAHELDWLVPVEQPVPGRLADAINVPVADVVAAATVTLITTGFTPELADRVVEELLAAELAGASSHGFLRVPEYVAAVAEGHLRPAAQPVVTILGTAVVVDGARAPGVVIHAVLADTLVAAAHRNGIALVGLQNGSHLGRLRPLAERTAAEGLVLLGFANFRGAGQKVAPPGGTEGRLATNPIVFGCPAQAGSAVIADLSTSSTAEGVIRLAHLRSLAVPAGLLRDRRGRPVREPGLLYTDPPGAFLEPLGGLVEHKGYALGLVAELLAGVVAGGGFVQPDATTPGNAGLFVAFPADALGRTRDQIAVDIAALERHLASCPTITGRGTPRLPGRRQSRQPTQSTSLELPTPLWEQISGLADQTETSGRIR